MPDLALNEEALADFIQGQRWFGSKSREVVGARVTEAVTVRTPPPQLVIALVEVRFQPGTHELYQLPLGVRAAEAGGDETVVAEQAGHEFYDALADPVLARELLQLIRAGASFTTADGTLEFTPAGGLGERATDFADVRPLGAEQSNSSVVFGDAFILKAYRRLEPGINPELELLRFLSERGFPHVPALAGWYAYTGRPADVTLGILQEFAQGEADGWETALAALETDPEGFLERLHRLGQVTGALHVALASDPNDPAFAPEEPSAEALALLTATIDEEIEAVFTSLPADLEAVEPIAGRGEEVRDALRLLSHAGSVGKVIRTHGDYHLGQVLWSGADWMLLDFEGEPARSIAERRRKRSPLRDVAGMLRSFAYAVSVARLVKGLDPPADWEERARAEFLAGYHEVAEPSGMLPPGREATARLLAVFELEKAIYELRYELDNRPDWVQIPVDGIARLLEAATAGAS
jgi:maltokinase